MKHCCHCGLGENIKKLRAGKIGILGGILVIGHLLFHVAECLVLPAIIMALRGNTAEAVELNEEDISEMAVTKVYQPHLQADFYESMAKYDILVLNYEVDSQFNK